MKHFNFLSFIYKWRFVIALCMAITMLALHGCKKIGAEVKQDLYKQYFEENVLNRDFGVSLATDNGADSTARFNGWVFKLLKNTYYEGPMTAIKSGVTYSGSWKCNEDFGKLIILINQPSVPPSFLFLNREWRFTKKDLPTMELAPWGSTAPVVLHMLRL